MTGILLQDFYSSVKKGKLYAAKATKVHIVSQMANVYIVENENGRFAINTKYLTIIN